MDLQKDLIVVFLEKKFVSGYLTLYDHANRQKLLHKRASIEKYFDFVARLACL